MSNTNIWNEVLKEAGTHLQKHLIQTWLKPLELAEISGNVIILEAPNKFYKSWVEEHYLTLIKSIFNDTLSINANVCININQTKKTPIITSTTTKQTPLSTPVDSTNLNKEYRFENFVIGNSNQFAHDACLAVSQGSSHIYNPLFIYGGVGLGKTHLIHAVGNRLIEQFSKLKIIYVPSEKFTNEMVLAIRTNKMDDFMNRYRTIDVLLLDDIQFMIGKERSTEVFFHTFNALYDSHKQIIVTSDRGPQKMVKSHKLPNDTIKMEERVTSRLSWGLIVDVQTPSVEEKTAILLKVAEQKSIDLPEEIALFLAENLKIDNNRELIGALIRLSAFSSFNNEQISIELAKKALKNFFITEDKILTSDDILKSTSSFYGVKINDLISKKRTKSISYARQISMFILKNKLNLSLQEIGNIFGGRDHSTVLHSINNIRIKLEDDKELQNTIKHIYKVLYE